MYGIQDFVVTRLWLRNDLLINSSTIVPTSGKGVTLDLLLCMVFDIQGQTVLKRVYQVIMITKTLTFS